MNGDDAADDHHYEALYEVINPYFRDGASAFASTSASAAPPLSAAAAAAADDSFDDSFDSDDAFEQVVVRGLVFIFIF